MMNDNMCRVDQTGVYCDEHKQYLKECSHLLQKCRLLQRSIIQYLKPKQATEDDFVKRARDLLVEAREHIAELHEKLELEQATVNHLNVVLSAKESENKILREALKQVL